MQVATPFMYGTPSIRQPLCAQWGYIPLQDNEVGWMNDLKVT